MELILLPYSLRKWKYGDGKKIVFKITADSDCTTPVSYTHLDVYKRQTEYCLLMLKFPFT